MLGKKKTKRKKDYTPKYLKIKSYHRQDDETKIAFSAFVTYRSLNKEDRDIPAMLKTERWDVADIFNWFHEFNWEARAEAFDDEQERQRRWRIFRDVEAMNKRQSQLGVACQSLVSKELRKIMAIADANPEEPALEVKEIIALGRFGTQTERLARGEATEIQETKEQQQTVDMSKLSNADLKKLKALKAKASGDGK